jgi:hypothetical protein
MEDGMKLIQRRLIIVGEGHSPTPLYGSAARKLCLAAGWAGGWEDDDRTYRILQDHAYLVGLCPDKTEAGIQADQLWVANPDGLFVLLGRRVARAFGHHGGWFETRSVDQALFTMLPGVNRIWNGLGTVESVGKVLRDMHAVTQHFW